MVRGPTATLSGVAAVLPRRVYLAIGLVLTHPWFHPIHRRLYAGRVGAAGRPGARHGHDPRPDARPERQARVVPLGPCVTARLDPHRLERRQGPMPAGSTTCARTGRDRGARRRGAAFLAREATATNRPAVAVVPRPTRVPGLSRADRRPSRCSCWSRHRCRRPSARSPTKRMPDIQVFGFERLVGDPRPRSASFASAASRSTASTCASGRSPPASCGGSSSGSVRGRCSTRRRGPTATPAWPTSAWTTPGIVDRLLRDNRLLRVPLVRHGNEVTAGKAEATWAAWLKPPGRRAAAPGADPERRSPATTRAAADDGPRDVAVHEARAREEAEALGHPDQPDDARATTAASIRPRIDPSV